MTEHQSSGTPDTATLIGFAGIVLIGGLNFVAVSKSNEQLQPFWGAGLRFGIAAVVLYVVCRVARLPIARGRDLVYVGVYGLLSFAGYGFAYAALMPPTGLRAATAAIVVASVPLFTLLLAVVSRLERFRWRALLGALVAVGGIAVSGADAAHGTRLVDLLLISGFVACAAAGTVVAKQFPMGHPLPTNAVAMAIGAVPLLALSRVFGESWGLPTAVGSQVAVVYLAVIGSGGLFGLYLFVVRRWVATATAFAIVLMPIVAAPAGALILGQPVGPLFYVGAVVVAVGVYVGALAPARGAGRPELAGSATPAASPAAATDG